MTDVATIAGLVLSLGAIESFLISSNLSISPVGASVNSNQLEEQRIGGCPVSP